MATPTKQRRINVIFPEELLAAVNQFVSPRQRNRFIVEATAKALHQARLAQALRELRAEPAWKEEDHPELKSVEDVDCYVRRLRKTWMPQAGAEAEVESGRNG